jgi:lipocalin
MPEQSVVKNVDLNKYSGKWYEIARLPNSFEKNLTCITATYTVRTDGKITVLNEGFRIDNPARKSSVKGIAFVPDHTQPGKLKVQFFWPFRGDYWILELDENYRFALIGGPSKKFLWILSKEKQPDQSILKMLSQKAADNGYDTAKLIFVDHDCRN